jgi:hypothetical protein
VYTERDTPLLLLIYLYIDICHIVTNLVLEGISA